MIDREFSKQIQGFSLATAEILYRMPDHPSLLQSFVWQCYDQHPSFPRINRFLDYWIANIDAQLHRVIVAHKGLVGPAELKLIAGEFRLQ